MFLQRAAANCWKRLRFHLLYCSSTIETATISSSSLLLFSRNGSFASQYSRNGYNYRMNYDDPFLWIIITAHAAIIIGMNTNPVLAKDPVVSISDNNTEGGDLAGLRRVEDGSVISNLHTSKWRVFTDNARDLFLQGKLEEAEKFFLSALQEAKEGFGERDPHAASAYNNLAELYRVTKAFDKAEPLYLEAINILEESYGPEDIRVGSAFHNLGQFYLVQRKLEEARLCYERALKIKGRVLGHGHMDYADTMYHLGTVLYLQGKEKDAEALIQDSIRIVEDCGQEESILCIRRLRYLAQIYLKSDRLVDGENVQRKILHIMELSKGWNSMDTINAAEGLALTLQSAGSLKEAQELLEKCFDARKSLLPHDHIQIGGNMLRIARVLILSSGRLRKTDISEATSELDNAKDLLNNSIRIAQGVLDKVSKYKGKKQDCGANEARMDARSALVILMQSFDALALLETTKLELQELKEDHLPIAEAENALSQCISAYKEFGADASISDSPEVKAGYLSCLKHLSNLMIDDDTAQRSRRVNLKDLKDEIKHLEAELNLYRKRKG